MVGLVLACAPIGGWAAVTGRLELVPLLLGGAVLFWVAGFDIIYSCQDAAFDRKAGLHSLPVRVGVGRALQLSTLLHLLSVFLLLGVGFWGSLGTFFWVGWGIVSMILLSEHRLISPTDLSRVNQAFFVMNGWVGVILFVAVFVDRVWMR